MSLSLLEIVQAVMGEAGLGTTNSAVGSYNDLVKQIVSLANALGRELATRRDWNALKSEYSFVTQYDNSQTATVTSGDASITDLTSTSSLSNSQWIVSGTGIPDDTFIESIDSATSLTMTRNATADGSAVAISFVQTHYDLPDDFLRVVNETQWDKTSQWPLIGPTSSKDWQSLKSGGPNIAPRVSFRFFGSYDGTEQFEIWPPVAANNSYQFEYVSENWVRSASGTPKSYFTSDNDRSLFPYTLMIEGTKLKLLQAKGLDTTASLQTYLGLLGAAMAQEAGATTLSMQQRSGIRLIGPWNLPDTGYGS